jgi:hypothetical protein
MGGESSTNGEKRNANRLLMVKPDGKKSLERPRRRWLHNIKIDLRDRMGWCRLDSYD